MSHLLPIADHTLRTPTVEGVPRHSEAAVPQEVHPDPDHQSDFSQKREQSTSASTGQTTGSSL